MSSGKRHLILIKADYKYPLEMSLCIYRDSHTKTPSHQIFLCKMYLKGKRTQVTLRANGAYKTQRTKLRVWSNAHKSLRKSLTKFAFKWFCATPDNSVSHTVCVHTGPDNWKHSLTSPVTCKDLWLKDARPRIWAYKKRINRY